MHVFFLGTVDFPAKEQDAKRKSRGLGYRNPQISSRIRKYF